jgi:hypothetical protein
LALLGTYFFRLYILLRNNLDAGTSNAGIKNVHCYFLSILQISNHHKPVIMKQLLFFAATVFFLCSCNFSKGVKKDLGTGLSSVYNGFTVDDIYLVDTEGNRLNSNAIALGSKISVVASGVDYFTEKDGKVFPGCRIVLTDKNNKDILNLPDAFASMTEGTSSTDARVLRASISTGNPMVVGETYHLNVQFFDKNNKENLIVSNVDLLMK